MTSLPRFQPIYRVSERGTRAREPFVCSARGSRPREVNTAQGSIVRRENLWETASLGGQAAQEERRGTLSSIVAACAGADRKTTNATNSSARSEKNNALENLEHCLSKNFPLEPGDRKTADAICIVVRARGELCRFNSFLGYGFCVEGRQGARLGMDVASRPWTIYIRAPLPPLS